MIKTIAQGALDVYTSSELSEFVEAYSCPDQNLDDRAQYTPQRV
jgi:hypothetical protein